MIDIVIPLGKGSKHQDIELKYALRSIQKFVTGYKDIYIVGEKPQFLNSDIKYIPFEETSDKPSKNILDKILKICTSSTISETFLFTNDDIFFIEPINIIKYPFYYHEDLVWNIERTHYLNWYKDYLMDTLACLSKEEFNIKNFDTHFPIRYHKQLFKEVYGEWRREWEDKKLLVKSLYCNTLDVKGEYKEDFKIKQALTYNQLIQVLKDRSIFSIGDTCINDDFKKLIYKFFPFKSKYEL